MFLLFGFVIIMGMVTYMSIARESAPDVKIPIIYVSMTHEGISPEDAERLLIRPMEKELSTIEGVKEMRAEATEGFASVTLEFNAGFDSVKALDDVRVKVDEAKPELPTDTDEPRVMEVNFSRFPILNVILTGDVEERTLVRIARDLRDKIEGINTVLEAQLSGDREEMLEIVIDPLVLESYNLSPEDVLRRVSRNNVLVPAGEMDTGSGRFSIKLPGLIETVIDLRDIPLKVDGEAVVTLKDVAEIRRGFKDPQSYARVNGKPAVGVAVSKRTGANIIETAQAVRELVAREQQYWPPGVQVLYSQDNSDEIRDMVSDLQNNVILAVLLVMAVVLVSMGWRSAGLIALSVPGSFLFGVLCIALMGGTLNIVVLFSLILSIGMLVDASIVVCEYADRRMLDGEPPMKAYAEGAKRMAWPIISSTATTLVVFMPLLVWPGVVGQFMKYMPLTLLVTLSGSLLMALIVMPALGAKLGRRASVSEAQARSILAAENGDLKDLGPIIHRYATWLIRALRHPWKFVVGLVALIITLFVLFGAVGAGVEFFPDIEPKNASLVIKARGNLSIDEKDALMRQVEARVMDMKEIRVLFTRVGKTTNREATEDTIGSLDMEFVNWQERRKADEILAEIRERAAGIPGVMLETAKQEEGPPTGKPVQIQLSSRAPEVLAPAIDKLLAGMQTIGGFINVEDNRPVPAIEWQINVNRELAGRYGVDVSAIGQVVKFVTNGVIINEYRPDDADDEIDIIVRFPREARNLSQLDRLRVFTPEGLAPIGQFISRDAKQKVGTINRVDQRRVMTIKADLEPGLNVDRKVQEIKALLAKSDIDPRVRVVFKGEDQEQKEAGAFLGGAFMIAIFLMALILVTQFNSLMDMAIILSAVVFSTGGVMLGLLLKHEPFGIVMCGVAVITLAGVVVNNNIIFIDTFRVLRREGMELEEALVRTGAQRLRPILLTAGTTVLGLVPMVFQLNIDFINLTVSHGAPSTQWWVQLSTAIAGGLTFATILTLFFTPCLLKLEAGMPAKWRGFVSRLPQLFGRANQKA